MRTPNMIDVLKAVTEVAPSYPEVAVWWYRRVETAGAPPVLLVLEPRDGARPDTERVASELARRLGPATSTIRLHRGVDEVQTLYRLLTARHGRAPAEHAETR
jgi:hypothetical protein